VSSVLQRVAIGKLVLEGSKGV